MPSQVMELKSDKGTAEIKGGDGTIDIQLPLTLKGWNLVELVASHGDLPAVVTSADGEYFIGTVTDVDEERYVVTVELS